jgi:hypothetical protein
MGKGDAAGGHVVNTPNRQKILAMIATQVHIKISKKVRMVI